MNDPSNNRRTVKLDDVRQNNIVWTDLNEGLTSSVFEQHFKKATEIICDIIDETNQQSEMWHPPCGESKNGDCRACRHRDSYGCKESSKPPVNWTKFHTAVPFIGERGTGKTSVMFSVLESLKRYRGESTSRLSSFEDVRFITFDMIDAAMLASTEDVMEIILSRMLSYLEEFSGESDFRDLYRQIDELHKNMNRVYGRKPDSREGYGLSSLQQIADGQKVKSDFSKLVSDFRNAISQHKFANKKCFLVIALDDVDLYQGADSGLHDPQYALLEHIYNFMRIPGLIVLMTYNEYILRRECGRHFAHIYFGKDKPKEREYTLSEREDIDNLTAQFMSKLFPQERRIYLPNYLFVNTNNEADLYISPILRGEDGEKPLAPFSKDQEPQVKEFMLRLIAHRTGVYFDAAGTKRHFFEARNLREFGELFQIVNDMKEPQNDDSIRAENCEKMLNYFYEQYALKHLKTEEYRQFQQIAMLPIARQKVWLIDRIRKQLETVGSVGHRWSYSYGELLRCIHNATRPDNEKRTILYSKEFIHCILGTHSVIMNRLTQQQKAQNSEKEQDRNNAQDNICEIIGSSVAGKWANKMLPSVTIVDTKYISDNSGSISTIPVFSYFNWTLPDNVVESILYYNTKKETLKEYLEALLLLGMFFSGAPKELRIKLKPDIDKENKLVVYLRSDSQKYICFNVLNFVINLYNHATYFESMCKKLKKLGNDFAQKMAAFLDQQKSAVQSEQEALNEKINGHVNQFRESPDDTTLADLNKKKDALISKMTAILSLENKVTSLGWVCEDFKRKWEQLVDDLVQNFSAAAITWQEKHGNDHLTVLPVEHFDMMYNILKRLANGSYYDKPEQIAVEEVYGYCVELYNNILKELKKQDDIYTADMSAARKTSFADAFLDSVFYSRYAGNGANKFIKDMHNQMMHSVWEAQVARRNQVFNPSVETSPIFE